MMRFPCKTASMVVFTVGLTVGVSATPATSATVFTDWTNIDLAANTATGTVGGVSVTLSGGDIYAKVEDGTSAKFNDPRVTPPLVSSDLVGIFGDDPSFTYTVEFTTPVWNPVLHLGSLASTLTFSSGSFSLSKLSGDAGFVVTSSQVIGEFDNTQTPLCQPH